jgi:hypothetical protein
MAMRARGNTHKKGADKVIFWFIISGLAYQTKERG